MIITLKYQLEVIVETNQELDRGQIYNLVNEITDYCISVEKPKDVSVEECYGSTNYPTICFNGIECGFLDLESTDMS